MTISDQLNKAMTLAIEKEERSQIGPLSGSNGLLYDGIDFEAESSDHCPRVALLRRVGDIQQKRNIKALLSNTHGRIYEQFLTNLLTQFTNIEFKSEEDAEVILEDENGNIILTARPDWIIKSEEQLIPLEMKTIQSNSSAYSVCIKGKPKLGAAIQLISYMYGHSSSKGLLVYAVANWFGGFAGKTRWSIEPQIKIFDCELTDGILYYNDNKSIVTVEKLLQGSYEFLKCKTNNTIPKRPMWIDINGSIATYSGCSLCPFSLTCDKADKMDLKLDEFFIEAQKGLNNENII